MSNLYGFIDHTNLSRTATWEDILELCDEAVEYGVASVMIPPCYVAKVNNAYKKKLKIGTVIVFPNGYNTTEVKCFETQQAIENGADEIDMVINTNYVNEKRFDLVQNEIKQIRAVCKEPILLDD